MASPSGSSGSGPSCGTLHEVAQTLGTHTACLNTDIKEFYDYLCPRPRCSKARRLFPAAPSHAGNLHRGQELQQLRQSRPLQSTRGRPHVVYFDSDTRRGARPGGPLPHPTPSGGWWSLCASGFATRRIHRLAQNRPPRPLLSSSGRLPRRGVSLSRARPPRPTSASTAATPPAAAFRTKSARTSTPYRASDAGNPLLADRPSLKRWQHGHRITMADGAHRMAPPLKAKDVCATRAPTSRTMLFLSQFGHLDLLGLRFPYKSLAHPCSGTPNQAGRGNLSQDGASCQAPPMQPAKRRAPCAGMNACGPPKGQSVWGRLGGNPRRRPENHANAPRQGLILPAFNRQRRKHEKSSTTTTTTAATTATTTIIQSGEAPF